MSVIQKKSIPSTNRSKSTSKPLYTLKDTFMCLFCGGKKCKHENYKNHPNPAINGLNCDQIDENIFVPVLWPNVIKDNKSINAYNFAKNILPLPCDQRYGIEEMDKIIKIVEEI